MPRAALAVIGHNSMSARTRLVCSQCGASAKGSCDCGVPYVPAGMRAAAAVEANPEKSDRAIAADLGIGRTTVQRARGGPHGPPDAGRTGRDGKRYRPKKKKPQSAQQQVRAFLKSLSGFMDEFNLSITQWHDGNPDIDSEGRDALVHSLSTYSMQLQILAQKIQDRES